MAKVAFRSDLLGSIPYSVVCDSRNVAAMPWRTQPTIVRIVYRLTHHSAKSHLFHAIGGVAQGKICLSKPATKFFAKWAAKLDCDRESPGTDDCSHVLPISAVKHIQ